MLEVIVVGGGQAGLALSYRLAEHGLSHVILERARIVESWRTKRWDSLRLIAPNWSLVLPGYAYDGEDPDGFMSRDEVVERLVRHATTFGAPVREGVCATGVERTPAGNLLVHTDADAYEAPHVVLATGALQRPIVPPFATSVPPTVAQLTAPEYRSPGALADGAVLVVGSGETGCQIAEELAIEGRTVYLACGRAWWAPRRYRGRDIAAWLRVVGWFDRTVEDLPPGVHAGQPNPQLTGAGGGHDINARSLARLGVALLGRLQAVADGVAVFADDLATNIEWADDQARALLESIDAVIDAQAIDAPAADRPLDLPPRGAGEMLGADAPTALDLEAAGIRTVIWATGYRPDFAWVGLPFLDDDGYPVHRRGVTDVAGLYVLGLDWLHSAKSGLFAGIDADATHLASVIAAHARHSNEE